MSWTEYDANTEWEERKMSTWESEMTPEAWKMVMEQKMAMERAIKALENVPEVNGIYDQQHSNTQLAAILELKEIIANVNGH